MDIITYNVNGIRAAIRKGLLDWIEQQSPEILCIQELKAQEDQIPVSQINDLGYHVYLHTAKKKGYSGVAIFTKKEPLHVEYGMGMPEYDDEGRVIRADYEDFSIISVYHPSGTSGEVRQDFKMKWLDDFYDYIMELKKEHPNLIISGDFNIAHQEIDIHDPVRNAKNSGFLPEEREWVTKFLNSGFIDSFRYLYPDKQEYTWWTYRFNARKNNKGWRIDYHMVSLPLKDKIKDAAILSDVHHSDHCPVLLVMDL